LEEKLSSGILKYKGIISDEDYLHLLAGLVVSDEVDRGVIAIIKSTFEAFNT